MSGPAIELRPLSRDTTSLIWDYLYLAIHVPPGEAAPPRAVIRLPEVARYADRWGAPGDRALLAVDVTSGHDVGLAWARLFPETSPGYGFVATTVPELSLAVREGWRGRGIGTRLLAGLLGELDADPTVPGTSLSVTRGNPAQRLYERHGFVVVQSAQSTLTMWRPRPGTGPRPPSAGD